MTTNKNEEQLTFDGVVVNDENTKAVAEPIAPSMAEQPPAQPQVVQHVPVQPVQMQQTPPVHTAPFGMKKPKKVGWIITLVFLILSLIGVGIGTGMAVSGATTLAKSVDSEALKKNGKPIENIGDGEFLITSLESGQMYYIMSTVTSGPAITGMEVDGVTIIEETAFESIDRNSSSVRVYSFTATDKTASLKLIGITDKTIGEIHVLDGEKYLSNFILIAAGGAILVVAGFIAFINLILFIIFLTIFLTRNNKYKQSLR